MRQAGVGVKQILTDAAIRNAMTVHAAMGGSTNLLLHIPAIAHAAGLRRPTREDFHEINLKVPRIVDCLPTGIHPTVRVFMAGGVPEVMLHLAALNLLDLDALTVTGLTLGENLQFWKDSDRRRILRERLLAEDGIDPDDVILSPPARVPSASVRPSPTRPATSPPKAASSRRPPSTAASSMPTASTETAPCRTFTNESSAINAVKEGTVRPGEVIVIMCRGPLGAGMPETYEVTAALKGIAELSDCALITDARFSGVTTGPCFGHVSPEALAPNSNLGKLRDGDMVEIFLDTKRLQGSLNLVGENGVAISAEHGDHILAQRAKREDLEIDPHLPDYIRQWALIQHLSGGPWGGCVEELTTLEAALGAAILPA